MSHFLKICSAGLLLAAASLAVQAADAPAAPQADDGVATMTPDAQVVVRDAATGHLRAPTDSESKTLRESGAALRQAVRAPMPRSHHSGARACA